LNKSSILIADDEPDVLQLVASNLVSAGFNVLSAADGQAALTIACRSQPSLAILDIIMPELTGFDVCKALKANPTTANIPIVMLSARPTEVDRVVAFELGVDDFVTKPFSPRELVLRVKAILRSIRAQKTEAGSIEAGAICVDRERHSVTVAGNDVDLTAIEFKLLCILLQAKGRAQTRETLLTEVWGLDSDIGGRTVDTHLRRLRDKLGAAARQIQTVRGFGYRLDDVAH
jgi:two-component system phosphate regulon response regulator PhoB